MVRRLTAEVVSGGGRETHGEGRLCGGGSGDSRWGGGSGDSRRRSSLGEEEGGWETHGGGRLGSHIDVMQKPGTD